MKLRRRADMLGNKRVRRNDFLNGGSHSGKRQTAEQCGKEGKCSGTSKIESAVLRFDSNRVCIKYAKVLVSRKYSEFCVKLPDLHRGNLTVIDEKRRRVPKISLQNAAKRMKCRDGLDGLDHMAQPSRALRRANLERDMAHSQTRMPALCLILGMAAKPLDQKQGKMFFGFGEIVRVQRAQDRIGLHAGIKSVYQGIKRCVIANLGVDF